MFIILRTAIYTASVGSVRFVNGRYCKRKKVRKSGYINVRLKADYMNQA